MRGASALSVACVLAVATSLRAQGAVIDHSGVACMVAEMYPRLEARIVDPEAISRARVQFRGEGGPWYYVEMNRSAGVFNGVLPRPKKSLKTIHYYIEATDRQFRVSRTAEFAASVVPDGTTCAGMKTMAGVASTASVLVGSPAGAPAVPAGFSSVGVASATGSAATGAGAAAGAGGGISAAATVGIVAGGAAIAGVAVAAKSGGDDTPATPAPIAGGPTTTTPGSGAPPSTLPAGTLTVYSGPFNGERVVTGIAGPGGCESTNSAWAGTITITLQSTGDATARGGATVMGTTRVLSNIGNCAIGGGNRVGDTGTFLWTPFVTGTLANLAFSATQEGSGIPESIAFSGGLASGVISGTVTFSVTGMGRSGTTTIPVTLR